MVCCLRKEWSTNEGSGTNIAQLVSSTSAGWQLLRFDESPCTLITEQYIAVMCAKAANQNMQNKFGYSDIQLYF